MDTVLRPNVSDSSERSLPMDFELSIAVGSHRHTYGDPVRGHVIFKAPEVMHLELLEMHFTGSCGAGIKLSSNGSQSPLKMQEEKDLFRHTQTIISQRQAKPGTHKFAFTFRFPRRDEVELAPSVEPFSSDNFFFFRYMITASAEFVDSRGDLRTLEATRRPEFFSSKDSEMQDDSSLRRFVVPAEPHHFVTDKLFSRRSSSDPAHDTHEKIKAILRPPRMIQNKEELTLPIAVRLEKASHRRGQRSSRRVKLSKVSVYLRSKIRLTAQGTSKTLDAGNNPPIQIASINIRKPSVAVPSDSEQDVDLTCELGLRVPPYLRSTFVNDLIAYEYLLKVKAELEIDGRRYIARFDHIPVILEPAFTMPEQDEWDYAASPPELLPSDLEFDFFTPPPFSPPTPPPEFSEFADEEVERRFGACLRQDSTGSIYLLPEPPKYECIGAATPLRSYSIP